MTLSEPEMLGAENVFGSCPQQDLPLIPVPDSGGDDEAADAGREAADDAGTTSPAG